MQGAPNLTKPECVARLLHKKQDLVGLHIWSPGLTDAVVQKLMEFVKVAKKLRALSLWGDGLGNESANELARALAANSMIESCLLCNYGSHIRIRESKNYTRREQAYLLLGQPLNGFFLLWYLQELNAGGARRMAISAVASALLKCRRIRHLALCKRGLLPSK